MIRHFLIYISPNGSHLLVRNGKNVYHQFENLLFLIQNFTPLVYKKSPQLMDKNRKFRTQCGTNAGVSPTALAPAQNPEKNLARFVLIFALSEVPIKLLGLNKLEYLNPGTCSVKGFLTMALAPPAYWLKTLKKLCSYSIFFCLNYQISLYMIIGNLSSISIQ